MMTATNQTPAPTELWNAALIAFEAAKAKRDALGATEDDPSPAWETACDEAWRLLEALLATPAPDGPAMGDKARLVIEEAFMEWTGDQADNPQTIGRLLAGTWPETALANLYIDGLRLGGSDSPIIDVQPDTFDPEVWLAEVEAATGARLSKCDQWGNTAFVAARDGADVDRAARQLRTLCPDHAWNVDQYAAERDQNVSPPITPVPLTPDREAIARDALIDLLASMAAKDTDRDAMRARIATAASVGAFN